MNYNAQGGDRHVAHDGDWRRCVAVPGRNISFYLAAVVILLRPPIIILLGQCSVFTVQHTDRSRSTICMIKSLINHMQTNSNAEFLIQGKLILLSLNCVEPFVDRSCRNVSRKMWPQTVSCWYLRFFAWDLQTERDGGRDLQTERVPFFYLLKKVRYSHFGKKNRQIVQVKTQKKSEL